MKLSVLKRNQLIQEIDLGKNVLKEDYSETIFLIGRSKDCHVVLDDKKISREHVRIIHLGGKWFLEKADVDNICLINGENLIRRELINGDVLSIENFLINFTESDYKVANSKSGEEFVSPFVQKNEEIVNHGKEVRVAGAAVDEARQVQADAKISSKSLEEADETSDLDENATREIKISEFSEELDEGQESLKNDKEEDLDKPFSDIESTSNLISNQITDVDIALSSEVADVEVVDDENGAYSLENIESSDDGDSTQLIQSFATVHLELFGETAPYDRFNIEQDKIFIGRDPSKCQIVLNDAEVSSVHAVINRNSIMLTLEDLNSSNGTIHKGDRINKVILGHNDEFVIGGVTFTVKIRSEFLKDESQTLMPVDENQTVEVEEVVEVQAEEGEHFDALGEMVQDSSKEKSIIKRILKDEQQRKKAIYAILLIVAAWVFLSEDEPTPPATSAKKSNEASKINNSKNAIKSAKKLSEDQMRSLSATYEIAKNHYNNGRYREALSELQKISAVDPNFNPNIQSMIALSKEGLSKIEEVEKERQAKILAAERKAKVSSLLEKAKEYTKERRIELANSTFNEITQIDPENFDVSKLKRELDDWQREKQRKELEEVQKRKEREEKVEKLKPSRTLVIQNEWFKAIVKLEEFLKIKDMDDDLTSEATEMLKKSRDNLTSAVSPLQGKAKSLLEGQDLKGAFEVYQQILRIEPSNSEALNQVGDIRDQLTIRARKIYREAIIAESLSLFQDAKEKFQEVQQISPIDSEYYKKASDKLKDYLD